MGILFLVSTPIGNLEDVTIRAVKTIFKVNIIACEDTRKTGLLIQELKKKYLKSILTSANKPKLIRFDSNVELNQTPLLIKYLKDGIDIALISDSGTPLISDPGYILVKEAKRYNIRVVPIPGPCAAITSLSVSGLPANMFCFMGFSPHKKSHRLNLFHTIMRISDLIHFTYIFYCSPHKLIRILADFQTVFGNREIVIVREMTKIHEEVYSGNIQNALERFQKPKGEFVVLINI